MAGPLFVKNIVSIWFSLAITETQKSNLQLPLWPSVFGADLVEKLHESSEYLRNLPIQGRAAYDRSLGPSNYHDSAPFIDATHFGS